MAKYQTEVQKEDAIRLGSCKFEVAPYGEEPQTFTSLGAMKGVKIAEQIEVVTIAPDNAPPIKRIGAQTITVSGEWLEPTLEGLALLRGGFDTLVQEAGSDTLSSGGKNTLGYVTIRLTNTSAAAKTYQITVFKAQVSKGLEQTFGADAALAPASIPLELVGEQDMSLGEGAQLFEIVDMQAPETPAV